MDLFLSFSCAILPVIRDCPWKIVSTAPVSRLHISRWYTMLDAYTDSAMGICDKMLYNTKFSFPCTHKKTAMFCKISSDIAPENDKRWTYGFMMDQLSTKTTKLFRVSNVCYQYKNRQCNEVCQLFPRNALQNWYKDHLLPFSRWIQSCQIPGNDKTVSMQRPSWMYTPSGHTTQKKVIMTSKQRRFDVVMTLSLRRVPVGQKCINVRILKTIWSFWYWDWNIPRWIFHTNVAHCKHHQVIIRHIHDNVG